MEYKESTFDELVKSLSTTEAKTMLQSIKTSLAKNNYDFEESNIANNDVRSKNIKNRATLAQEPFFVRVILHIVAFFTGNTVQATHNKYLLRLLARELKRTAASYYLPSACIFTNNFYNDLKELHKTQLFFSGLLQIYNSEKDEFFIVLSSFLAPNIYESLIKKTDPFSYKISDDPTLNTRNNYSKETDNVLKQLTEDQKSALYNAAKSIEWMKNLCDATLDKALLKFTGTAEGSICDASSILSEMQMLASILNSAKKIPDEVLQTLFLLFNQENLTVRKGNLEEEMEKFQVDAVNSLKSIDRFISAIPMIQILQHVGKDVSWEPFKLEAGEDWYIFFKHAWRERLNKKWDDFSAQKEKEKLTKTMLSILEVDELLTISYEPWKMLNFENPFAKELSFKFLKTLFNTKVSHYIKVLNVVAKNGNFIKKDNHKEFLESFSELKQFSEFIHSFETMLSPEGDIGLGFEKLKNEKVVGLTFKKNLDVLIKSVDTNFRQLITNCTKIFQSFYALLNGIFSGSKKGFYATLINIDNLDGNKSNEYKEKLKVVYDQTSQILTILEKLEKIEK